MARPKKQVVDYFPHGAQPGKTIFILENRWGNDGYAFWFKLLETLCSSKGHVYDYGNPSAREFLLAKTKVDEETAINILSKLAELGKIDAELWADNKIWCQNLVDNVRDAYKKRIDEIPEKPSLSRNKPPCSEFPTPETPLEPVSVDGSAQTKVKETKLNKTKLNNIYTIEFELFYSEYPRSENKSQTFTNWKSQLKKGLTPELLIQAAKNYKAKCVADKKDKEYFYISSNFLGKANYVEDYIGGGEITGTDKQSTGEVQAENKYAAAKSSKFFS